MAKKNVEIPPMRRLLLPLVLAVVVAACGGGGAAPTALPKGSVVGWSGEAKVTYHSVQASAETTVVWEIKDVVWVVDELLELQATVSSYGISSGRVEMDATQVAPECTFTGKTTFKLNSEELSALTVRTDGTYKGSIRRLADNNTVTGCGLEPFDLPAQMLLDIDSAADFGARNNRHLQGTKTIDPGGGTKITSTWDFYPILELPNP